MNVGHFALVLAIGAAAGPALAADANAVASAGPVTLTVVDLTPSDSVAAAAVIQENSARYGLVIAAGGIGVSEFWTMDSAPFYLEDVSAGSFASATQTPASWSVSVEAHARPGDIPLEGSVFAAGGASVMLSLSPGTQITLSGTMSLDLDGGSTQGASASSIVGVIQSDEPFGGTRGGTEVRLQRNAEEGARNFASQAFSFTVANESSSPVTYKLYEVLEARAATPVPEMSTALLLALGLGAGTLHRRRSAARACGRG